MTFNPLAGKLIAQISGQAEGGLSVVELGNQTFTVSDKILEQVPGWVGGRIDKIRFKNIQTLDALGRKNKVADYYRALGFEEYTSIDVNDKFGSLAMDLNENLKTHYGFEKEYDLVTNNGTGEHIFDQAMVFRNIHQLAKQGGLMLHVMPFLHWENHGFYNYNPILYLDVAEANHYEVVRLSIANRWGDEVLVALESPVNKRTQADNGKVVVGGSWLGTIPGAAVVGQFIQHLQIVVSSWGKSKELSVQEFCENIKYPGKGLRLAAEIRGLQKNRWDNILVTALLRKQRKESFRYPIQGKYFQDIKDVTIEKRYA